MDRVDHRVGQAAFGHLPRRVGIDPVKVVSPRGADPHVEPGDRPDRRLDGLGIRIHDPGQRVHLDEAVCPGSRRAERGRLHHRIGQQRRHEVIKVTVVQLAFDQVDDGRLDPGRGRCQPERLGVAPRGLAPGVRLTRAGTNFDAMHGGHGGRHRS